MLKPSSRQGLKDRATLAGAASVGLIVVVILGALSRFVGVSGMTFIAIGLFIIVAALLVWMVGRMKTLGLHPPPLSEIRRADRDSVSEES